jgi:hypothetical protein
MKILSSFLDSQSFKRSFLFRGVPDHMKPSSPVKENNEKDDPREELKDLKKDLEFLKTFVRENAKSDMTQLQEDLSKIQEKLAMSEKEYTAGDIQKIKTDLVKQMGIMDTTEIDRLHFRFDSGWSEGHEKNAREYFVGHVTDKCVEEGVAPLSFEELKNLFKDISKRLYPNEISRELLYGPKNSFEENKTAEAEIDAWIQEHKVVPLNELKAEQEKMKEDLKKKQDFMSSIDAF